MGTFIKQFLNWCQFSCANQSDDIRLICTYRYGSLLITSFFYMLQGSMMLLGYKIAVVVSMYFAARLLTEIYPKYSNYPEKLKAVITFETVIITLLLIPTGGLNSPFIWYALNPVLVAAWYSSTYFCWFNLFFYLLISSIITADIFTKADLSQVIIQYSYLLLVFVLITFLVQLLAALYKRLQLSNSKQRESLEHIMSLYQIIETFTNEDNLQTFFQIFINYASKLSKSKIAFFWENENDIGKFYCTENIDGRLKEVLVKELRENIANNPDFETIFELNNRKFITVLVKSSAKIYGILGVEIEDPGNNCEALLRKQLTFLSELSSIVLWRLSLEETNKKLTLLEERNRIAHEIHDNVSQRLFSISCALYSMKTNWDVLTTKEIKHELSLLGNSANLALRELRQSIYRLSTLKSGERIFFSCIKTYLNELAELNDIEIKVELTGEEEIITSGLQKCLYRIICEATGNAVRHGKSNVIQVHLGINSQYTTLIIEDNGKGFEIDKLSKENSGLGLVNIRNLVLSFSGKLILESKNGLGTKIEVEIPNLVRYQENQGGIA